VEGLIFYFNPLFSYFPGIEEKNNEKFKGDLKCLKLQSSVFQIQTKRCIVQNNISGKNILNWWSKSSNPETLSYVKFYHREITYAGGTTELATHYLFEVPEPVLLKPDGSTIAWAERLNERSGKHCRCERIAAVLSCDVWTFWTYKVVQIWRELIVCKQVTVFPGHIWTTLYMHLYVKGIICTKINNATLELRE
jgi:hypothetical protein